MSDAQVDPMETVRQRPRRTGSRADAAGGGLHLARGAGLGAAAPVRRAAGPAWAGVADLLPARRGRRWADPAGRRGRRRRGAAGPGRRRGCGCSRTPAGTAATSCCPRARRRSGSSITCPYHAWTYDLAGALVGAPGFREDADLRAGRARPGRAAGDGLGGLGVRARAARAGQRPRCRRSTDHLGDLGRLVAPYDLRGAGARRPAHLRGRGELEGDRGELPRVLPLPADPPASCARSARRTPATTTTCPVPGWAGRWSCATAWRRCR